jgi:hypothetical protein
MRFYDNTMLSAHKQCRRKYLMRHVLHWTGTGMSPELGFGLSWHSAMDAVWAAFHAGEKETKEIARAGFHAFSDTWYEKCGFPHPGESDPSVWADFKYRTPDTAAEMLLNYIPDRRRMLSGEMELLAIEQPFVVPLDPEDPTLFYCGRIDKLVRWRGKVWVIDHKTSSQYRVDGGFAPGFTQSFSPNSQVDGYAFAAHMLYGAEFKGVLIDAALVWKTRHDVFDWIPIEKHASTLDSWLVEAREEVALIESQHARLAQYQDTHYLPVFPRNTNACWDYNRCCLYADICATQGNPLAVGKPEGMIVEQWSPFEQNRIAELGLSQDPEVSK